MINKLLSMSKQEGMFDIALLLAYKYNLEDDLLKLLSNNNKITIDVLKSLINEKIKHDDKYLNVCYNLKELYIQTQSVHSLDLRNNKYLQILNIVLTKIQHLDLTYNPLLTRLYAYNNKLETLYLDNNKLKTIECYNNKIKSLELSKCINLTRLSCDNNPIEHLDLSNNLNLKILHISYTKIKHLDLSKHTNLIELECKGDYIKEIILSKKVKNNVYLNVNCKVLFI